MPISRTQAFGDSRLANRSLVGFKKPCLQLLLIPVWMLMMLLPKSLSFSFIDRTTALTIRIQVLANIRRSGRHLSSYLSSYLMDFCKIRLILDITIWRREGNNIVGIQIIVKTSKMPNKKEVAQTSYRYSANIVIAHNRYNEGCHSMYITPGQLAHTPKHSSGNTRFCKAND